MKTPTSQLACELRDLGIGTGDTVMVHASLRAVGPVEGKAQGLVEAMLLVLGNQGTLLTYVDFEPTHDMPYFDPERSPARAEYGVLAEIIRTWPGAVRSLNPGGSMVAIGSRADWICRDHPMNYGYGPGTPLSKLVDIDGKILLLGSDFDNITLLHYAEHCADLPDKRVIHRTDKVRYGDTVIDVTIEEFDTSQPVINTMPSNYFARITQQFVNAGYAQTGIVGQAHSVLLLAKDFVSFAIDKMEREFVT